MFGQMMERQLLISGIIEHAARYHGDTEIVSVNTDGSQHRTNYAQLRDRSKQIGSALLKRGMKQSDRIGTLAWNNHRHLELYYGISGVGLVCHTVNPRLFPEEMTYIMDHAGDRMIFFDQTFLPLAGAGVTAKLNGRTVWSKEATRMSKAQELYSTWLENTEEDGE